MPPSHKQQVVDLLKSLETKDWVPFACVNPNKYIQHNLQVGPGPEGVAALIQDMPPDASFRTCRPMRQSTPSVSLKTAIMSSLTLNTTSSGHASASTSFASTMV